MTFGQPWAFGLLVLAAPIVLMHLLRGNPRRVSIPAAFLWRGLEQPTTARWRWRRPPRSAALLLQLLALATGALALTQPALSQGGGRQLVLLFDASASMQATDVSPNRFEAARAAIRQQLAGLEAGDRVSLIRLGSVAEALVENGSPLEAARSLELATPGVGAINVRDGLALAGRQFDRTVSAGSEVIVYTDGTFDDPVGLGPLPAPVRFVRLGRGGDNQGVSSLQVRPQPDESGRLSVFAQLTNYADRSTRVSAQLAADGILLETRLVDLPPRGRLGLSYDVPAGTRTVSVSTPKKDSFSLDDRAEVSVVENRRRSVLLVSRSPEAWQQALGAVRNVQLELQSPDGYHDSGAELVVLDGFLPPTLPGGQLVIANPPSGSPYLEVRGELRNVQIGSFDATSPLFRSIEPGSLRLLEASRLAVPAWGSVVAETAGGPLIVQGELDGRQAVVLGFDPLASGLEKLVAFPILVANTVEYLATSGVDPFVRPGQSATLPAASGAASALLERPDGSRQPEIVQGGSVALAGLDQVGRYTLRQRRADGSEAGSRTFFVDLFGESEADTAPREHASWPAVADAGLSAGRPVPGASLWLPFAVVSLMLLGLEWLHFVRRG